MRAPTRAAKSISVTAAKFIGTTTGTYVYDVWKGVTFISVVDPGGGISRFSFEQLQRFGDPQRSRPIEWAIQAIELLEKSNDPSISPNANL